MDLDRLLAETPGALPGFASLARYLFFTATGHTLPDAPAAPKPAAKAKGKAAPQDAMDAGPVLIGETAVWRIYLHYRADEAWLRSPAAALTRTQAEAIAAESKASGRQVLVFAAALSHTRVAVDVDQLGPDPRKPLGEAEAGGRPELDFPALVRLLVDVIPNPWQAARILRGALAALRARGFTEDQLLASRYRLIETMRTDLLASIHTHTERIFCELLASGGLSFRLEGNGLNWELAEKLAFGWKKKRVFPDFLVALEESDGKPSRLVVVETKGLHLQNDDTEYKRRLFETLEKHSGTGVPVGELTLDTKPGPMRFRLVLEGDWKSQVDAACAAADA